MNVDTVFVNKPVRLLQLHQTLITCLDPNLQMHTNMPEKRTSVDFGDMPALDILIAEDVIVIKYFLTCAEHIQSKGIAEDVAAARLQT